MHCWYVTFIIMIKPCIAILAGKDYPLWVVKEKISCVILKCNDFIKPYMEMLGCSRVQ